MTEDPTPKSAPLLSVADFSLGFNTESGLVPVVEGLNVTVGRGETVGLVGESGCGKSVTAMSILKLLPSPPARVLGGAIHFDGVDVGGLDEPAMRRLRGGRIGMVFQEPMTSLNPTLTIGYQLREILRLHGVARGRLADRRAAELLALAGIGAPEQRLRQYPHELSGGLRQRVMIAMAIACAPELLIADEPTTALDVTIQAQILDLLRRLRRELGMAVLMITHDLGVVAEFCDRVVVMYAGQVAEMADVRTLFRHPRHPYTYGLLASLPSRSARGAVLPAIPGAVPDPGRRRAGCRFAERCPRALARCADEFPPMQPIADGHHLACWNPELAGAEA